MYWRRCCRGRRFSWWYLLSLCFRGLRFSSSAQPFNEGEVSRNDEDAHRCCDLHAEEHTRAHDILCARSCTACLHQRYDSENEGERSHENWTKPQTRRRQCSVFK